MGALLAGLGDLLRVTPPKASPFTGNLDEPCESSIGSARCPAPQSGGAYECGSPTVFTTGTNAPTRVPVTLAIVDSTLTGDGSFRILRRADQSPHDIILLRHDIDVAELSGAIESLLLIRGQTGDTAKVNGTTRIQRSGRNPERPSRVLPWAGRVLNDLRRVQPRAVAGVGIVPTVEVWLPPQASRRHR